MITDPVERLMRLTTIPGVTDVLVLPDGSVHLDRGHGIEDSGYRLGPPDLLRTVAVRLAGLGHRRLDDAAPWVDAPLERGVRLHAIIPPACPDGTAICLRIPAASGFGLVDLVARGSLDKQGADLLRTILSARLSFLVTGGTGSGKTTILAALLGELGDRERIVVVEESAELRPACAHLVRLEARAPNIEGSGAITMRDLVRQALRMRPDRLVVGEARGPEVLDLLAALNSGHEGGCATVHANSPQGVPARLYSLAAQAGVTPEALAPQIAAAIDVVLHVRRASPVRVLDRVCVLPFGGAIDPVDVVVRDGAGWRRCDDGVRLLGARLQARGVGPEVWPDA